MTTPEDIKSQPVRLLDVLVLGPLMIFAASRCAGTAKPVAFALGATGVGTILYNLRNYRRIEKAKEE